MVRIREEDTFSMCRLAIKGLNYITLDLSNRLFDFITGQSDMSLYEAQQDIDINNQLFDIIDRNCSKVGIRMEKAVSELARNMRVLTKDWYDHVAIGQKEFKGYKGERFPPKGGDYPP